MAWSKSKSKKTEPESVNPVLLLKWSQTGDLLNRGVSDKGQWLGELLNHQSFKLCTRAIYIYTQIYLHTYDHQRDQVLSQRELWFLELERRMIFSTSFIKCFMVIHHLSFSLKTNNVLCKVLQEETAGNWQAWKHRKSLSLTIRATMVEILWLGYLHTARMTNKFNLFSVNTADFPGLSCSEIAITFSLFAENVWN